ncbi:MAG: SGNH/GDSL hydrolase family protein [Chthoniobacteraceae bacterium]
MNPTRFLALTLFLSLTHVRADDRATASAKWEPEIAAFEKADREHPPEKGGIVFVGSSSIRLWKTLAQDFPEHRVLNRGFGGSQIADSVQFAERIIIPYAPRQVVLYAGGNDLNAGKTPEQVIADFKAFAGKIRAALPDTHIAYISSAPSPSRWAQVEKVKAVNSAIEAWIKEQPRMAFINVFPRVLGADGLPKAEIYVEDKLHFNAAGYVIWKEVVKPFLLN